MLNGGRGRNHVLIVSEIITIRYTRAVVLILNYTNRLHCPDFFSLRVKRERLVDLFQILAEAKGQFFLGGSEGGINIG